MEASPNRTGETNTMTTSKLKRLAIPTALVVGGVTAGSFLAPIGFASAQESDSDSDSTETETDGAVGEGHHHRGRNARGFAAKAEVLEDLLGLSAEEIRDAMVDGDSLAAVAEAQGVPVDDLTASLVAAASERIDEAVADGKLDADEAAERKAGLEERVAEMVNRVPEEGFGERGGRRGHGGFLRGGLDTIEETLGLSAEEIRAGFADGKTLADLAAEAGVSTDDLADALVAQATERLDEAVADGKLDEDRAATAKEQLEERIDAAIEAEPFALGRGIGRSESLGLRHHHRDQHHGGGDAPSDDGEVVESSLVDA